MGAQASATTFELHSLGWKAFQDLCSTILSEVLGQTFEVFLPTRDAGRDGSFQGNWKPQDGEFFTGPFTVQCKFTAKRDKNLTLSDLSDEISKAETLGCQGLAETYILMTNAGVSAETATDLRRTFLALQGIQHFAIYGSDWINLKIRHSQRLRMLVPRVYGLGDLSQILDERAFRQAQEILNVFREELAKFVITEAHQRTIRTLFDSGFVLLLGEPAAGKTTIALAVALAAADKWGRAPTLIRSADDFVEHWNPDEPRQFFWIDDAFGDRQFKSELTTAWNRALPHLKAAVRKGAWVLFTSRDYIFRAARPHLKDSVFPLIVDSKVIIEVQRLSLSEKEQILYNHLRLGSQPKEFRSAIKPYLPSIAVNPAFLPEIARRLADPVFTRNLSLSEHGVRTFVERPVAFLVEIIRHLDAASRAALALLVIRAGIVPIPIDLTLEEEEALRRIGASISGVLEAFEALSGSLVTRSIERGEASWRFRHPTIRDAFGEFIAGNSGLLDIYLKGTPVEKLMEEVICGDIALEGAKVLVPPSRFAVMLSRIDGTNWENTYLCWCIRHFLARRCSTDFLTLWAQSRPHQVRLLLEDLSRAANLMAHLQTAGLLAEADRRRYVAYVDSRAIDVPEPEFMEEDLRPLFTDDEWLSLCTRVAEDLVPNLENLIDDMRSNFGLDSGDDPEDYYEQLKSAFRDFEMGFMIPTDEAVFPFDPWEISQVFARAQDSIDEAIERLKVRIEERKAEKEEEVRRAMEFLDETFGHPTRKTDDDRAKEKQEVPHHSPPVIRSVFDDVDE